MLVCDIEGAEYAALPAAADLIAASVQVLILELHPWDDGGASRDPATLVAQLRDWGLTTSVCWREMEGGGRGAVVLATSAGRDHPVLPDWNRA